MTYWLPVPIDTSPSPDTIDPDDLLMVSEVARILGWRTSTLRGRLARSNLRIGRRVGPNLRYYSRADVERIRGLLS